MFLKICKLGCLLIQNKIVGNPKTMYFVYHQQERANITTVTALARS